MHRFQFARACSAGGPLATAMLLVLLVLPQLCAGAFFQCRLDDDSLLFTDLPCPAASAPLVVEAAPGSGPPANFVGVGLDQADRDHLRRIDAGRERYRRSGVVRGLRAPERVAGCERARQRLAQHRDRARRPHRGSLLERGRSLGAEVRRLCN
jgi:hypothetical protein